MTQLPDGRSFWRRVVWLSCLISLPGLAIVLACLYTLLELTREQWWDFYRLVGVYALLVTPLTAWVQSRYLISLTRYLDRRAAGSVADAQRRRAFRAALDLPRRVSIMSFTSWLAPSLVLSFGMGAISPGWNAFETAVMLLAGGAAGFTNAGFSYYLVKRLAQPVREQLTAELPDPDERRRLVRGMSLRSKTLTTVGGITTIPVVFAVLMALNTTQRAVEAVTLRWQRDIVAARASGAVPHGVPLPGSLELLTLDPASALPEHAAIEPHVLDHLRGRIAAGVDAGDSRALAADSAFAWQRLPDGRVLLALSPVPGFDGELSSAWRVFALLLLVSTGIALGLAYLLASDVSRATGALRRESERLASGDLRGGRVYESEDELGELSRAFEGMSTWLRATVSRVAEAADRVEATSLELAGVTESVGSVTADQVRGIQQAATSMEAINGQVRGIADSSQALNVSVEESSSSILELGAAGEELNETASVLSSRVSEVSSSIEQMVRSVRQVVENTEALSEASVETSASMEEMATSLRGVDVSAEQAARLSHEVVASAELGQAKVRQTIVGMEAIREATETAESVIRSLGGRTKEIGAIVDVIDDVADETNLLALNAAIIAAQAGEHGRAFTVVADEIKDLADRVLASTKEIGSLIRSLQAEAADAIGAVEQGSKSVASGVDLSAEAGVSLEAITQASRESGSRIAEIVGAVREQAKAAVHVVALMERVRSGVDEIRKAASEQDRGNEVVYRGAVAMREVAAQVRGTTEEQARGSGRIRESVEGVRAAVEQINGALQEQSAACRSAVEFLEAVHARTQSNEESTRRMDAATRELLRQAETLREDVARFRIE